MPKYNDIIKAGYNKMKNDPENCGMTTKEIMLQMAAEWYCYYKIYEIGESEEYNSYIP